MIYFMALFKFPLKTPLIKRILEILIHKNKTRRMEKMKLIKLLTEWEAQLLSEYSKIYDVNNSEDGINDLSNPFVTSSELKKKAFNNEIEGSAKMQLLLYKAKNKVYLS